MKKKETNPNVLEVLEDFLRETIAKPGAPVSASDIKMVFETFLNRPLIENEPFPGITILQMVVGRIIVDEATNATLRQTKEGKSLLALLPYISQLCGNVIEWQTSNPASSETA